MPEVIEDLTTHHILTTELVNGVALDKIGHIDQELKNKVRQKNKNEINIASALEFSMKFFMLGGQKHPAANSRRAFHLQIHAN